MIPLSPSDSMDTKEIVLGRDDSLQEFFSLSFLWLDKSDRDILFSAFLKTVQAESTAEQPMWWPLDTPYYHDVGISDMRT